MKDSWRLSSKFKVLGRVSFRNTRDQARDRSATGVSFSHSVGKGSWPGKPSEHGLVK